ncbi:NYN domain-containing protein [Candidatus Parcubacteria bacterium]|nr:MAG: NYN domain-containing protein [Candidatus Parcubacteria bacterium]
MLDTSNRRVGVFIDVQNMYYSARNLFGRKVNYPAIVEQVVGNQKLIRAIAYSVATEAGDETAFFDALEKNGIEVIAKELIEYDSGIKKGNWDVGIAIDIVRMIDMLDVVVMVSGDGDFAPLGDYVRSKGRIFHVASFKESTSSELLDTADIYTNLSANKPIYLIPEAQAVRPAKNKTKTALKI